MQKGCFLGETISWNIVYDVVKKISKFSVVDRRREKKISEYYGNCMHIKAPNLDKAKVLQLSGVSVARMRILIFALAGLFFGLAQVVSIGKIGSVNNSMGVGSEFTVMAGAMLGGIKMGGGKMHNMVVGVLIIGVLNAGMNFLNINRYWQYVFLGVVLLAAITVDTLQTQSVSKKAKKSSRHFSRRGDSRRTAERVARKSARQNKRAVRFFLTAPF